MNVLVYADAHLYRTEDGKIWARTIYGYGFWKRYLNVFENITVIARMQNARKEDVENFCESSGPNVSFVGLPMVRGSQNKFGYIAQFPRALKIAHRTVRTADCGIFRVPAVMGYIVLHLFAKTKRPYALEIVANPFHTYSFGNNIEKNILGYYLKRAASRANGVSYVTQYNLQQLFPSYARLHGESVRHFESYYSSIDLRKEYFSVPRDYKKHTGSFKIIHVANQMNDYTKCHKTVIDVTQSLRKSGYDIQTFLIGDGTKRKEFEEYAYSKGLSDAVHFVGILSSTEKVREWLLNSDLFLFPARAEGLPRALIEAMAVGLPCLSSPEGGIPELLPEEYLFMPADTEGIANKIVQLLSNPLQLNEMSKSNIDKARKYEHSILQERRDVFLNKLKKLV